MAAGGGPDTARTPVTHRAAEFSVQPRRGFLRCRVLRYRFPALAHTRRPAFAFRRSGIRFGLSASFVGFISCHEGIQVFRQCVHPGSRGGRNKTPQTRCLKTREVYPLVVLRARTPAVRVGPFWKLENFFLASLPAPGGLQQSWAFRPCQPDTEVGLSPGVSPCLPRSSPVCVCVSLFSPCEDTRHWI